MLPPTLCSVYRKYKEDTDAVATWLASNAKKGDCPPDLLVSPAKASPAQQNKSGGRLKGKARREAKRGGQSASKPASPKHVLPLRSFVPLAEHILASQRTPFVPAHFQKTLDRVIAIRSSFGEQLQENGAQPSAASDDKHSFFNNILIKVRDILRPKMPAPAASNVSADDSADSLWATMAALEVTEPSSDLPTEPDDERPTEADDDADKYEAEQQMTLEDAMLAFIMMLNDLNRIRSQISWIWSNQFDVAAAAVATNTGLDLARHLMSDVLPLLDMHGGAWNMTHKFYAICCLQKGFSLDSLQSDNGMLNQDTYDIADSVLMIPFFFLKSFTDVLQPQMLPLIKEGMFGYYDPTRSRATMSSQAKFQEDQVLLMETLTELMIIIRLLPDFPVRDEFLRGMDEMDRTRAIPYYLVFAAQIFLDTNHQLRDETSAHCASVMKQLSTMSNDLDIHFDFHEKLKIDSWPASNDQALVAIQSLINWIGPDPLLVAKKKQYTRQGMPLSDTIQQHRLLHRSPVLAGLVLFHFRARMYEVGISVANAWGSISYSNHLYNAMLREGLLRGRWSDMDVAQMALGSASFFVGEPPSNRNQYLSRFCLQMGISAAALRASPANRRGNARRRLASRSGPRGIKTGVPVSSMFEERYIGGTERLEWTPEQVDQVVSRAEFEIEGSVEDGNFALGHIDDTDRLREIRMAQQGKAKRKTGSDTARLAPHKLIQSLVLALQAETLEHAFHYLVLHRFSWRLLRAVKKACDPLLRSIYSPGYLERETELPFVVGYIFMAADTESGTPPDDRLLHKAAEAMNAMIKVGAGGISQLTLQSATGIRVELEE